MPYFKNDKINVLFIHIPKTGGSSIEQYFSIKYNIELDSKSLFGKRNNNLHKDIIINSSLQHITFKEMITYKDAFNIDFNNIKIITSVRNPYMRIISDLFYLKLININTSKEEVYKVIQNYISSNKLNNHNVPQYIFLTDDNLNINDNIIILKTETLTNDMISLGYEDFDIIANQNSLKINYYDYLNDKSLKLINNYYDFDFKIFNYDKIIK